MRRIFYKGILAEEIKIGGEDAAHLMYSMRAKKGERITAVDDANNAAVMEMVAFSDKEVTLRLVEPIDNNDDGGLKIILAQCILKSAAMELTVQKAVELGAKKIIPITSRNTVVRFSDEKKAEDKARRWQKIADEAAKQCGANELTEIAAPMSLQDFLTEYAGKHIIFCYENEDAVAFCQQLKETTGDEIILLIGAEGGFTLREAEEIIAHGGKAVTLGKRILRAETAAIVATALARYLPTIDMASVIPDAEKGG